MPRIVWGAAGKRLYEVGVDRGVLYVGTAPGVPWDGLVSVTESPSGFSSKPTYLDGVKIQNRVVGEEFEATIDAYTYPEEFAKCDGTALVSNGLFATQQRRRPFGFSYRTLMGNDLVGTDYGYKIHLVYDAIAEPSEHANQSISDSDDGFNFSWHITTKPSIFSGAAPTAHLVIDSTKTPNDLLRYIEEILYGNELDPPRLPSAGELAYLFATFETTVYDAGGPLDPFYMTFDAGTPETIPTTFFDGGSP